MLRISQQTTDEQLACVTAASPRKKSDLLRGEAAVTQANEQLDIPSAEELALSKECHQISFPV